MLTIKRTGRIMVLLLIMTFSVMIMTACGSKADEKAGNTAVSEGSAGTENTAVSEQSE